jgi:hypothetical protein
MFIGFMFIVLPDCGIYPASYSMGTGVIFGGQSGRSVELTIYLLKLQRLRMSGAIPLPPLYGFMVWRWKTLPLTFTERLPSVRFCIVKYVQYRPNHKVGFYKFVTLT